MDGILLKNPMKPVRLTPRAVALTLSLVLCLPSPAFGLRVEELLQSTGLEELHRALTGLEEPPKPLLMPSEGPPWEELGAFLERHGQEIITQGRLLHLYGGKFWRREVNENLFRSAPLASPEMFEGRRQGMDEFFHLRYLPRLEERFETLRDFRLRLRASWGRDIRLSSESFGVLSAVIGGLVVFEGEQKAREWVRLILEDAARQMGRDFIRIPEEPLGWLLLQAAEEAFLERKEVLKELLVDLTQVEGILGFHFPSQWRGALVFALIGQFHLIPDNVFPPNDSPSILHLNRSLSFLGDALLEEWAARQFLEEAYSGKGTWFEAKELGQLIPQLSRNEVLWRIIEGSGLWRFVRLRSLHGGLFERKKGGGKELRHKKADRLEAILAAVYLAGGWEAFDRATKRSYAKTILGKERYDFQEVLRKIPTFLSVAPPSDPDLSPESPPTAGLEEHWLDGLSPQERLALVHYGERIGVFGGDGERFWKYLARPRVLPYDLDGLLNHTPSQEEVIRSLEPLQYAAGSLYHGGELDGLLHSGRLEGEIPLSRLGYEYATGVFRRRDVSDPAMYVIRTDLFNRSLQQGRATLEFNQDSRRFGSAVVNPTIRDVEAQEIHEVWLREDSYQRHRTLLETLFRPDQIKVIPGVELGSSDDEALHHRVFRAFFRYALNRDLLKEIPPYEVRAAAGLELPPGYVEESGGVGAVVDGAGSFDLGHVENLRVVQQRLSEFLSRGDASAINALGFPMLVDHGSMTWWRKSDWGRLGEEVVEAAIRHLQARDQHRRVQSYWLVELGYAAGENGGQIILILPEFDAGLEERFILLPKESLPQGELRKRVRVPFQWREPTTLRVSLQQIGDDLGLPAAITEEVTDGLLSLSGLEEGA